MHMRARAASCAMRWRLFMTETNLIPTAALQKSHHHSKSLLKDRTFPVVHIHCSSEYTVSQLPRSYLSGIFQSLLVNIFHLCNLSKFYAPSCYADNFLWQRFMPSRQ